jgi:hypothetical protein
MFLLLLHRVLSETPLTVDVQRISRNLGSLSSYDPEQQKALFKQETQDKSLF